MNYSILYICKKMNIGHLKKKMMIAYETMNRYLDLHVDMVKQTYMKMLRQSPRKLWTLSDNSSQGMMPSDKLLLVLSKSMLEIQYETEIKLITRKQTEDHELYSIHP